MKTYAQMEAARGRESLCCSCQHRDMCRMACAISDEERKPWLDVMGDTFLVSISQCYHYLPEAPVEVTLEELIK